MVGVVQKRRGSGGGGGMLEGWSRGLRGASSKGGLWKGGQCLRGGVWEDGRRGMGSSQVSIQATRDGVLPGTSAVAGGADMTKHQKEAKVAARTQQKEEEEVLGVKHGGVAPRMPPSVFEHMSDVYLGGLWNRIESEIRQHEGESYTYDVNLVDGVLHVMLADDVVVHVSKRLNENSLVVECMMPNSGVGGYTTGSGDVAEFVFDPEMEDFVDGLVTLLNTWKIALLRI